MKPYQNLFEDAYNAKAKYKLFNKLYFDTALPDMELNLVKLRRTAAQVVANDHIDLNADFFNTATEKNKDAVLIHEMIHVWVNVKGFGRQGNLHQGEFLRKAKELEKITGLKLAGTRTKDSEDYTDAEKISMIAVIKTYSRDFLKKNAVSIDFYSTLEKAKEVIRPVERYFYHIYKIDTNSPIVSYDVAKKNVDTSKGWITYTTNFVKDIMDGIKKYSEYSELIEIV